MNTENLEDLLRHLIAQDATGEILAQLKRTNKLLTEIRDLLKEDIEE
jgi:hypothetical protein